MNWFSCAIKEMESIINKTVTETYKDSDKSNGEITELATNKFREFLARFKKLIGL